MPVERVTWPDASWIEAGLDGKTTKLNDRTPPLPEEWAKEAIAQSLAAGFPEPTVRLIDGMAPIWGEEIGGMTMHIWANVYTHQTFLQVYWHELGHAIDKSFMTEEACTKYWQLRGEPSDAALLQSDGKMEIFAEDFRMLFGSEEARKAPHTKRLYVGDLGFSMPEVLQKTMLTSSGLTFVQLQDELRNIIMSCIPKEGKDIIVETQFPFPDKPTYKEAEEAVLKLYKAGLIKGDDKGKLNPLEPISRQDFFVFMARALKL